MPPKRSNLKKKLPLVGWWQKTRATKPKKTVNWWDKWASPTKAQWASAKRLQRKDNATAKRALLQLAAPLKTSTPKKRGRVGRSSQENEDARQIPTQKGQTPRVDPSTYEKSEAVQVQSQEKNMHVAG